MLNKYLLLLLFNVLGVCLILLGFACFLKVVYSVLWLCIVCGALYSLLGLCIVCRGFIFPKNTLNTVKLEKQTLSLENTSPGSKADFSKKKECYFVDGG